MANKTNTTNKGNNVNASIIEVVVNGLTTIEVVADVNERLESVEKSVFNIALECAYALGITIPKYTDKMGNEHGEAMCEKPFTKQSELLKHVNRSKQTLSRWILAMKHVLEEGYFTLFANGTLPFSYDKIILICENKTIFEKYVFSDLMAFSVSQLEELVKKNTKTEEAEEETAEEATEELEEESTEESTEEMTVIFYNGKEYSVPKVAFEKWLSENGIVNVTK